MAMVKGSVTIAGDGSATGNGAAKAIYDAMVSKMGSSLPMVQAARRQVADVAEAISELVDYIKANGEVTTTIGAGDAGLQRVSGNDTQGPSGTKTLGTKGTIG